MTIDTLTGWYNSRYYIAGVASGCVYKREDGTWGAQVFENPPAYYPYRYIGAGYPSIVAAKRAIEAHFADASAPTLPDCAACLFVRCGKTPATCPLPGPDPNPDHDRDRDEADAADAFAEAQERGEEGRN